MNRISYSIKPYQDYLKSLFTGRSKVGERDLIFMGIVPSAFVTTNFIILASLLSTTTTLSTTIAACAFAIAIPIQVGCVWLFLIGRQYKSFTYSNSITAVEIGSSILTFIGIDASFWHLSWLAGAFFLVMIILAFVCVTLELSKAQEEMIPVYVQKDINNEADRENFLCFLQESRAKGSDPELDMSVKIDVKIALQSEDYTQEVDKMHVFFNFKVGTVYLIILIKKNLYNFFVSTGDNTVQIRGYLMVMKQDDPRYQKTESIHRAKALVLTSK